MKCRRWIERPPLMVLVTIGVLLLGSAEADAAYRLVFRNGSSVEVRAYEDLGDSIRYPRLGGAVTVPEGDLSSIQEVPSGPAPNTSPPPAPQFLPTPAPLSQPRSLPSTETSPPASIRTPPAAAKPIRPASIDPTSGATGVIGSFASLLWIVLLVGAGLVFLIRMLPLIAGRGTEWSALPYERSGPLLTPAERSLYGALSHTVEGRCLIFAKVRLGDLIRVPSGAGKSWSYRNRIDRKHVDFVLCAPDDLSPLMVVELDDSSHDRRDRRERDTILDAALKAAGLPILHVPAQHAYAPAALRALLDDRLNDKASLCPKAEVEL